MLCPSGAVLNRKGSSTPQQQLVAVAVVEAPHSVLGVQLLGVLVGLLQPAAAVRLARHQYRWRLRVLCTRLMLAAAALMRRRVAVQLPHQLGLCQPHSQPSRGKVWVLVLLLRACLCLGMTWAVAWAGLTRPTSVVQLLPVTLQEPVSSRGRARRPVV